MKVLLVDDSAFMRMMITNAIKDVPGIEIKEANDGNEAIAAYQEFKPGITFMDVVMPEKNGIEALREIRKIDPEANIVMCTSLGGQENIVTEAVEAGAADFVTKPFKPEEVRSMVLQCETKIAEAAQAATAQPQDAQNPAPATPPTQAPQ